MGALEPSFNDGFSARLATKELLAKRYHLESDPQATLPILHHPSQELVLVGVGDLRLAEVRSGAVRVTLEGAAQFGAGSAHFWPKTGSRIVGVVSGEVAVWDAATGTRLWATGR